MLTHEVSATLGLARASKIMSLVKKEINLLGNYGKCAFVRLNYEHKWTWRTFSVVPVNCFCYFKNKLESFPN